MRYLKMLFCFLFIFMIACTTNQEPDNNDELDEKKDTTNYIINIKKEYTIYVDDIITLDETISEKEIIYSSSSNNIKLNGYVITGLSEGKASVKAECNEYEVEITINVLAKVELIVEKREYTIIEGDSVEIIAQIKNGTGEIRYSSDSEIIKLENNKVIGLLEGVAEVIVSYGSHTIEVKINVLIKEDFEVVPKIDLYVTEKKELTINVIKGDINNIILDYDDSIISIDNKFEITGISSGVTYVKVTLGNREEIITVEVKELSLVVVSGDVTLDIFETKELELEYPKFISEPIKYIVSNDDILEVVDGVICPKKEGQTKIRVQIGDSSDLRDIITVKITLDPIAIMKSVHIENVLMKKEVNTYGSSMKTQSVMGGVSRYYFGDLNLIVNIIDIYSNEYVGQKATPELLEIVEPMKLPRTGIKLEQIKYITYHDTGNNAEGAWADGNVNYMTSQGSIDYRARSWHFTVDANKVIQSIPDDEVTWQGDTYGAYATSIGIETCVNAGSKLNVTWQRMGKLCAMLMVKHGLNMDSIKQHYDWNGKECPQTLRRNNLYDYAISMIEAEWMIRRALNKYTITYESLSPEYLDRTGQIIKNPEMPITVSYKITITNSNGYNESVTLTSNVNPLN